MPAARSSSGYAGDGAASKAGGSSTDHQSAAAPLSFAGPVPATPGTAKEGSMRPPGSMGGSPTGGTDGASTTGSGGPGIASRASPRGSRGVSSGHIRTTGDCSDPTARAGSSVAHTAPAAITTCATTAISPLGTQGRWAVALAPDSISRSRMEILQQAVSNTLAHPAFGAMERT